MRLLLLVLLAAVASGCTEEVAPPGDLDAFYTLWGAFDPLADVQRVRVVPVTRTIGLGRPDPLPVTVTSRDVTTGATVAWRDSVVAYDDGSFGHVYQAEFRPEFGSRHVFAVTLEDGTDVSALVTVPLLVEPVRQPTTLTFGVAYPVLWPGAPRLNQIRVRYVFENDECEAVPFEHAPPGIGEAVEFGWETTLEMRNVTRDVVSQLAPGPYAIREITITAEVASEDWRPPGGVFDRDLLVEPGTLSNVTNGFGFIGSAYPLSISWSPTSAELSRANFRTPGFGC